MRRGVSQVASAHVDRRGRILVALIVAVGASAVLVRVAPAFAADPAPDPPPTETAPTPDPAPVPEPAPSEPQPSSPAPAPAPIASPPASSSPTTSGTQTSGSAVSSSAKPDRRPAKRKQRKAAQGSRSEALPAGWRWQRARNEAFTTAPTVPAGAPEAVAVRATLSSGSSSAPFLPAALAAALATILLAATPTFALNASRVLRPVEERRFELATIGLCILVGIAVAKGLPA
jgi:hypothetical protein